MTDFVNDAVSASDLCTDIPPADPDTIEVRLVVNCQEIPTPMLIAYLN